MKIRIVLKPEREYSKIWIKIFQGMLICLIAVSALPKGVPHD